MKTQSKVLAAIGFGLSVAFAQVAAANAADVRVFTARAIATVLEKVGPEFERTTGHKLDVVSGFGPVFVRQINAGDPFDVFVSLPPTIDPVFKDGKLLADSRTNLVRSGTGVAVRAGAPKPDISSVEAFKQALLNARSVGYLATAGVPQLVERLGMTEAIKSKVTVPSTDIVSELVAKGELELGVVVMTQILTTPASSWSARFRRRFNSTRCSSEGSAPIRRRRTRRGRCSGFSRDRRPSRSSNRRVWSRGEAPFNSSDVGTGKHQAELNLLWTPLFSAT